uniref:Microtubule actin crosslinking factor 1 n=1 Tax=Poecilia reticulata TaxID=8081 RepID=A0A3P9NKK2_POERE
MGKLHVDRSPELERYQERANQMAERWSGVKRQTETRRSDLEVLGLALQQYRQNHSALIRWIEETTERQESAQAGQTDSRALSEQLAQQTALVAEIEQNQTKLDECQTYSKQYCTSVKDYEMQLMTYRAFVESTHKSPVKRRRMHSSSDAITQEFMDLRTRYTALVTLTTQHVKYISDALRRLEEEEKEVEEEKQARVGQVSELLGWVKGLQGRTGGPSAESSLAAQQVAPGAVAVKCCLEMAEVQRDLQAKADSVAQAVRSVEEFLAEKGDGLSAEEKKNLQVALERLKEQNAALTDSTNTSLSELNDAISTTVQKSEALQDELTKFLQEHGNLGSWLELSEQELRSLGEGETDLGEDVICHKADLRFVSISGQKVLDSVQGALEQAGGSDPALDGIRRLVSDKLQDANHRYTALHTKSTELGGRLGGLLERYQQYQDEVVSIHSWLSAHEQNQSIAKSSGDTDPQNLQNALRQLLQDELAERSVQLEKVKRAGRDLVSADESPSLKAVDILCRFGSLSASVSERAEQLQTAVAQSVSVQEGLKGLLGWLDQLVLNPGPVQPTAQAVQDAQGSVEATRDSVSKLLQSSDASAAPGLHGSLDDLTRRYAAAQSSQAEREAQLKALLPRLESYERLGVDLQAFTQSRLKALSPAGQPDRSVHDYRQTVEVSGVLLLSRSFLLRRRCNFFHLCDSRR